MFRTVRVWMGIIGICSMLFITHTVSAKNQPAFPRRQWLTISMP